MGLRKHQRKACAAAFAALDRGILRQLIVMPTGGGKTHILSHVVKGRGGRTVIIAHRDELISQIYKTIKRVIPGASVGLLRAGIHEIDKQIIIASVQSLVRGNWLAKIGHVHTLIIDEAHHSEARTYRRIMRQLVGDNTLLLGLTATPFRGKGRDAGLREIFGMSADDEPTHKATILDGIREHWLCDVDGKQIFLKDADFSGLHIKKGDYDLAEMEAIMRAANWHELVTRAYLEHARDRKTLIFVPSVAMAHQLADWMRGLGILAEAVDGTMPMRQRRDALARFADGRLQVAINCAVLNEGFDEPSITCVMMARPTRMPGLYIQSIGRGLRPQKGKRLLVLDIVGATERHDLMGLAGLAKVQKLMPGEGLFAALRRREDEEKERQRAEGEMVARRVELIKRKEEPMPACIHCGSANVRSKGRGRNGKRKGNCKDCGRQFLERPEGWKPAPREPMPACTHCGSANVRSAGREKHGKRRGNCKDCGRQFLERPEGWKPAPREPMPACTHCGSANVWSAGRAKHGKRAGRCKDCRRYFFEQPEGWKPVPREPMPACTHCGSANVRNRGRGRNGKRAGKCKDCGRHFTEKTGDGKAPTQVSDKLGAIYDRITQSLDDQSRMLTQAVDQRVEAMRRQGDAASTVIDRITRIPPAGDLISKKG